MADITLTYKGNTIAEISDSGTKTLETGGKYCEDDIGLTYIKSAGEDLLEKRITNTLAEYRNTKLMSLTNAAFNGCSKLEKIFLPNASSGTQSFYQNSSLVSAVIGTVYQFTFQSCSKLEIADICLSGTVQAQGFSGCSKLETVIIRRSDAINSLNNINAFNNTPFASGGTGGTIYVPEALISSYQSASNWSTILGYANNQIKKIEGTIYATHYADGTEIT